MSWNYRVFRHPDEDDQQVFGIHEAFYNDVGEVEGWTEDPILVSESVEGLLQELEHLRESVKKDVIDVRPEAVTLPGKEAK